MRWGQISCLVRNSQSPSRSLHSLGSLISDSQGLGPAALGPARPGVPCLGLRLKGEEVVLCHSARVLCPRGSPARME